jgi:hypothetical protein
MANASAFSMSLGDNPRFIICLFDFSICLIISCISRERFFDLSLDGPSGARLFTSSDIFLRRSLIFFALKRFRHVVEKVADVERGSGDRVLMKKRRVAWCWGTPTHESAMPPWRLLRENIVPRREYQEWPEGMWLSRLLLMSVENEWTGVVRWKKGRCCRTSQPISLNNRRGSLWTAQYRIWRQKHYKFRKLILYLGF